MKKTAKFLVAIVLALALVFTYTSFARADSGWDSSYDSGGWDSGGWDSGSDWGTSWGNDYDYGGSHHYSSSSGDADFIFVIVVFIVILILVFSAASNNKKNGTAVSRTALDKSYESAVSVEEVQKVLPDFDYNVFKSQVFEIYKTIQTAWMDFDYDTLRKYTTDELYNLYHSQLMALSVKKQKNVMRDFEYLNFRITGIEHNEKQVSLKVYASISCIDYVEDANHEVVRGSAEYRLTYNYEMTFVKGLGKKDNKCPNCNAPLENVQSSVCPYCDSTIISDSHDWVLSKKEMISQRRS